MNEAARLPGRRLGARAAGRRGEKDEGEEEHLC
jgi:hypothetical protein